MTSPGQNDSFEFTVYIVVKADLLYTVQHLLTTVARRCHKLLRHVFKRLQLYFIRLVGLIIQVVNKLHATVVSNSCIQWKSAL